MSRIGVFICFCGTNIANKVDIQEVTDYISKLDDVVVAKNYEYMCSDPGQEMIKETIREEDLSGVVVASCSPSLHEETFQSVVEDGGLNRYLFQQANIREQCSWVTEDPEDATEKAKTLVKGAVKRVSMQEPLESSEVEMSRKATSIAVVCVACILQNTLSFIRNTCRKGKPLFHISTYGPPGSVTMNLPEKPLKKKGLNI